MCPAMSTPNGYIQDRYPAPESAVNLVSEHLEDFGPKTSHFFKHVLVSTPRSKDPKRRIPVCKRLIREEIRGAKPLSLFETGLLQKWPYLRFKGMSRRWRIPDRFYNRFCRTIVESAGDKRYDLFTEKKTEWTFKSRKYDENNNAHPDLIQNVMDVLTTGYFNREAIEDHFNGYEKRIKKLKKNLQDTQDDSSEYVQARKELRATTSRRNSDLMCWNTVLNQSSRQVSGPVYQYDLAYKPQSTGRITQIGGGLQNASGEMKAAAYSGIDSRHNYDIKASQASIFRQLLAEADLRTTFLDEYLSDPDAKHTYAEKVGLNTGTWKSALYAICMGAYLPKNIAKSDGDISLLFRQELKQENGEGDTEELQNVYNRFRKVTSDFLPQVEKWRDHLLTEWIPEHRYQARGGYWVKNDIGCRFKLPSDGSNKDWVPSLIAFRLQGREAHFIHTLTLKADSHGTEIISNEHDGLVTIGEIPDTVVERARRATGMEYIKLPEKPFV